MKQSKNEINLGEGSVGRLLLTLAVPSVIAQLVNLLYNLVDRIYIGHIPENGGVALTGLGLCFPILMIVTAFSGLIGYGGAPRVAIFMGKGKNDEAEEILGNYHGIDRDRIDFSCGTAVGSGAASDAVWCK